MEDMSYLKAEKIVLNYSFLYIIGLPTNHSNIDNHSNLVQQLPPSANFLHRLNKKCIILNKVVQDEGIIFQAYVITIIRFQLYDAEVKISLSKKFLYDVSKDGVDLA